MWSLVQRYRSHLLVGALLLTPLILLFAQTRDPGARGPVGVVVDVAGLLERGLLAVTGTITDGLHTYVLNVSAREEAAGLRMEATRARALKTRIGELEAENETLRALAGHALRLDGPRPIGARVIGRSGAPLSRIARIDRGRRDGLRRGDPVLAEGGAFGHVLATGYASSDVLLLTDPGASLDVVVQRTRARGILAGTGDEDAYRASVQNFSRHADLKGGDTLVTSGVGSRFPPGILVGAASEPEVTEDNLFTRVVVTPAADFATVEHVLVLINRELPRLPTLQETEAVEADPSRDGGP